MIRFEKLILNQHLTMSEGGGFSPTNQIVGTMNQTTEHTGGGGEIETNAKECPVCCDPYNKSTRKKVSCGCGYTACKDCIRTYLLGTANDPHCMNCNRGWTDQFLTENLNRSFVIKDYKEHRKNVLLERQLAQMPETMPLVERIRESERIIQESNVFLKQIEEKENEIKVLRGLRRKAVNEAHEVRYGSAKSEKEASKFVMPCPAEDCRGYLSTSYKCGNCENYTCPHCMEVVGKERNPAGHVCNPEKVESVKFIKSNTKPCPSCGERIGKTSGCDQMWCVTCKTAFSWRTGKIDNGPVHNPHFYQYQAQNPGGAMRNPRDVPCGGLVNISGAHYLSRSIRRILKDRHSELVVENENLYRKVMYLHRTISHYTFDTIPHVRQEIRDLENTEEIRVNYLMDKYSREEVADNAYRLDTTRKNRTDKLHLYELLSTFGIERFRDLQGKFREIEIQYNGKISEEKLIELAVSMNSLFQIFVDEFNHFRIYFNRTMAEISISQGNTAEFLTQNFEMRRIKFTKKLYDAVTFEENLHEIIMIQSNHSREYQKKRQAKLQAQAQAEQAQAQAQQVEQAQAE